MLIGETLAEVKIQSGIFQGDLLSPLPTVIEMMSSNNILGKCTGRRNSFNRKKILSTLYTGKNEKDFKTLIQTISMYSQDFRMEFDIQKVLSY